jgi:pimeloyl-ACP methyl ester carboxylesterase
VTLASVRLGAPGGRAALLAHCFLGHAGAWKGLVGRLAAPVDALAFDLPGHGRSPMPAASGDLLAEVAAELPGLLAALGPAPLGFGHSFGGAVLLRHALAEPAAFAGLVLIEPTVFAAARGTPEYADWQAAEAAVHAALAEGRAEDAVRAFLAENGDGTPWEAIPAAERARLIRLIPLVSSTAPGLVADTGGLIGPGRLEGLAAPVLLLAGDRSPPIFRAVCRGLAARLPRARVELVAGAGHMLPVTHAARVARLIDAWRARNGI